MFVCINCGRKYGTEKAMLLHQRNKNCFVKEDPKTQLFIDWVCLEKRRQKLETNGFITWSKNVMKLNTDFIACYSDYLNHKQIAPDESHS